MAYFSSLHSKAPVFPGFYKSLVSPDNSLLSRDARTDPMNKHISGELGNSGHGKGVLW